MENATMRLAWHLSILLLVGSGADLHAAEQPAPKVDFNRDIKPILSNNCFQCHGPDEAERKGGSGGLRLDLLEGATADLGGYAAVVPGQPQKSALVERITSSDANLLMPPAATGKKLSAREIELLRQWVAQGAAFAQHWSYVKPRRPELPEVRDASWPLGAVDRFILNRLDREGLKPSAEADRYALIRRLSLDLTGLPPTLAEVDAFVADDEPQAYERLVDRLLASPAYGEHWAQLWLDLARYADSAGYADDPPRTIWLYRDYVIRSLNAGKPFDQFTIEQIAGDLLPNPSQEQLIATAFHRNTLTNNEGGTNDEEFRNVAVVDRVNTTLAVWMGTTIACAQCHSHKFDPISQEEYFRLFAIFNSTEDADKRDEQPLLSFYTDEQQRQRAEWEVEIAALEKKLATPTPEVVAGQEAWEREFPLNLKWRSPRPTAAQSKAGVELSISDDGAIRVPKGAKTDTYTIEMPLESGVVRALRLAALTDEALPGKGPGHAGGNFVVASVSARLAAAADQPMVEGSEQSIEFAAAVADYAQAGFEPEHVLKNKDPKQKGWAIAGQTGQPHMLTLVTQAPVEILAGSKLIVTIEHAEKLAHHTLGHFRLSLTDDAQAALWGQTPAAAIEALRVTPDKRTAAQQELLAAHYRTIAPALQATRQRLATVRKQLADSKPVTVPMMRELPADKRRVTRLQHRGNFLDLGDEVTPGTPAIFPPLPAGEKPDRLGLARWLIDDDNPLTSRVIANRCWEQLFGIGIVSSSEEFGAQGEQPSHPQLLDWLATELVRLRWDLKAFLKVLVTSAAYRQTSQVTPELVARDPDNRLLARGPRVRLSAEMVRDQALAASGLLSAKMYGPPVKPPQPALGINAAFGGGIDWQTSTGEDRYRRALYTLWRRSSPYPSMTTFDAPNREVCTVRRGRTNTPLQALVTLNDPVYIEAAQALARRIVAEGGSSMDEQVRYGFRLVLARPPHIEEAARLARLLEQAMARFRQHPEEAKKLATDPLGAAPPGQDVAELAAWTVVGNVLLNLDETLMKR